jgi:hypothetical protein
MVGGKQYIAVAAGGNSSSTSARQLSDRVRVP